VRNITDIDDKINKRAFERWTKKRPLLEEVRALTDVTAKQYEDDVAALGNLPPTYAPRATDFVCNGSQPMDMVRVIERLVAKGHAYAAEGHVLFHVPSMPDYGKLSRRTLDDMIAGARVEVAPYKRDPMDFVLWKPSDPATEPGWESPWGFGRPGWHIECSAMSGALLGEQFDIHAGGIDLIFPHHENEIAQTCCAFGVDKMASVWMHNGFLQVEGQKMSKSLGNFFTIREIIGTTMFGELPWTPMSARFAMLTAHYRQPIDWTVDRIAQASANLHTFLLIVELALGEDLDRRREIVSELERLGPTPELISYLLDDLDTPKVIYSHLFMLVGHADKKEGIQREPALKLLRDLIFLGLNPFTFAEQERNHPAFKRLSETEVQHIESLVSLRVSARAAKNFAESDRIRDELLAMGIQLKDGKDPVTGAPVTTWELKR
jgi:cysteinyl-tRNA synthetase